MPKNKILEINPVGGLANRMRTLAGGITLASELDVDYKVIWFKNWEINADPHELFDSECDFLEKTICPSALKYYGIYSAPRKKNLYVSGVAQLRYGAKILDPFPAMHQMTDEQLRLHVNRKFRKGFEHSRVCYLQNCDNIYPFSAELYRKLFRPSEEIVSRVKAITTLLEDDYYGLHLRRTDNKMSISNSPDHLFEEKIQEILRKNPSTKFYLATDSEEVKSKFSGKFGENIVTSKSVATRDTPAGIKDAMVELFVLASSKHIYGSFYSSYSAAASILGKVELTNLTI